MMTWKLGILISLGSFTVLTAVSCNDDQPPSESTFSYPD